jgi:hypothetical protein
VFGSETATEISRRGGVGNSRGTQSVQIRFVLSPQFQVLQAPPIAQRVIGDVQDVVGLMVRQVELEQVQPLINRRRQTERPRQLMHKRDAAVSRADGSLRHLILDIGGPEHGLPKIIREVEFVQALQDSPLASTTATRHNSVHSKSLRECGGSFSLTRMKHRKTPKDFEFLFFSPCETHRATLD